MGRVTVGHNTPSGCSKADPGKIRVSLGTPGFSRSSSSVSSGDMSASCQKKFIDFEFSGKLRNRGHEVTLAD